MQKVCNTHHAITWELNHFESIEIWQITWSMWLTDGARVLITDLCALYECRFHLNSNFSVDNELLWPSWRRFNTIHLKSSELKNYMHKIFTKKIENSPQNVSWIFFGIQGVDASYVSNERHFFSIFDTLMNNNWWLLIFQSPGLHLPSARERANSINRNISKWLSGVWSLNANVVALDYFCGTNLIDIAVNANLQKRTNNSQYLVLDIND